MVSTGIPGIVFGFLHLFYCIACGLQGVPVANNYKVWSYVLIIDWYHHLLTVLHTFILISNIFTGLLMSDIDQWNSFVWFSQSWPWHWCMPSLHLEWYYVTNDSGVYFYFCSSVEACSPLKVLSFMNFLWILMNFNEFLWYFLNFMKPCNACGFILNDNQIAMKNCTLRAINF